MYPAVNLINIQSPDVVRFTVVAKILKLTHKHIDMQLVYIGTYTALLQYTTYQS